MKVAVTGATGYIGERLVRRADQRGHAVVMLSRKRPAQADVEWRAFALDRTGEIDLPEDADAVIHLAANTGDRSGVSPDQEVGAASALVAAAARIGARFVFVSSQAAHAGAVSEYGRTKWAIERLVAAADGVIVRPGLVYGGPLRGLYGRLASLVLRHRVLPALVPAPKVQPVHVDDLVDALLATLTASDARARTFRIGATEPVSFTRFLRELGILRWRKRTLFVPLPTPAVRAVLAISAGSPSLQSLRSLLTLKPMSTAEDMRDLGITLRPLSAGMERSGADRRRRLLLEAGSLTRHVARRQVSSGPLRLYLRAVEALRGGEPLGLSRTALRCPWLIPAGCRHINPAELAWRVNLATRVVEADPDRVARFLPAEASRASFVVWSVRAVLGEAVWRALHLVLGSRRGTRR